MGGINWSGIGQIQNPFASFADGLQKGNDLRRQQERDDLYARRQDFEIQRAQRAEALADEEQRRRKSVGSSLAGGDYAGARTAAQGDPDLLSAIGKLDADQRAQARQNAADLGGFAQGLLAVPYEQRKGVIGHAGETLQRYGMKPEDIAAFDPTDAALRAYAVSAMDLKTALEESNRQRDDKRADDQAAETRRHNGVTEGQGAGRLAIARDANARGWAAHRERKAAGGYGTPGAPAGGSINPNDVDWD